MVTPPTSASGSRIVIVGAGVAGRAASEALGTTPHLVLERDIRGGERVRGGAEAVGLFRDDTTPFLAVVENESLSLISFKRLLLANGGHPSLPTFPNNDLPGVISGRAVRMLVEGHSDNASAKRMGVSTRTYAGYVASLKTEYNVETRFQLGYAIGQQEEQQPSGPGASD